MKGNHAAQRDSVPPVRDPDEAWMEVALDQARKAQSAGEVPVGAVLVIDDREVARAHNAPIRRCDPTAHAELLVLRKAALRLGEYRLPRATLYVTMEPCAMCLGAALHARIARLVFGAADPKFGAAGSVVDLTAVAGFNHRIKLRAGLFADQSAQLLRDFFRGRRAQGQTPRQTRGTRVATRRDAG